MGIFTGTGRQEFTGKELAISREGNGPISFASIVTTLMIPNSNP
jgi:hypothetical protein